MLRGLTDPASVRCSWVDVTLNQTSNGHSVVISANKREVKSLWDNIPVTTYPNYYYGNFSPVPVYPNCYYVDFSGVTKYPNYYYEDYSVLGSPFFKNGKHYWEVDVSKNSSWILGVCGENHCQRNVNNPPNNQNIYAGLQPRFCIWAIGLQNQSEYHAFDEETHSQTPKMLSLSMTVPPSRVGVFLDYEVGTVSFYNVTNHGSHIYEYSKCGFPERVCPYLNPLKCKLPMAICKPGP